MARILVLQSVWAEYEMSEEDLLEQIELLKVSPHYSEIEFGQTDTLFDTIEQIKPTNEQHSIECRNDANEVIWTNGEDN